MANTPTENKPDWIAATLSGQLKDTSVLLPLKMKAKDFDFRAPDDYWSKETVQKSFNGDRKQFDDFYAKEKERYDRTQKNDYELDMDADVLVTKWTVKPQVSYSFKDSQPDPWGRNRFGDYYTPARWSIPEAAIKEGVRLSNGSYAPVEGFKGPVRLAKNSDGSYKFNDKNKPYWEPVPPGEEIKSTDEVYSGLAESVGAYGLHNNWAKEELYAVGKTIYNFGLKAADSLLEPGRLLSEIPQNNTVMDWQSKLRGYNLPDSVQAREGGFWSPQSLLSVGVDSALQLLAMKGVNRGAMALGADPRTASIAGRMFLTGIAAGPIAQMSREHGLNPTETALLYGATVLGVYKISNLSDMAVNGMRQMEFYNTISKEIPEAFGLTVAKTGFSQSGVKAFVDQIGIRFKNSLGTLGKMGSKIGEKVGTVGQFAQTGVLESAEEVLEQTLDSGLRGLHDLIAPVAGLDGRFNWDAGQEFQGILQAGAGGFIGGNVAHGLMRKMGHYEREKIDSFEAMVAQGDESFGFRTIDNWEKAGRLSGNPDPIKRAEENRNNASLMRETLKAMIEIRDKAGLKDVLRNNIKAAGKFAEILKKSSILRDQVIQGNELHVLENQLTEAQVGKAPKEKIESLVAQVDAKKAQIEQLKSGKMVSRFITEGLYNTHAEEMFFGKNFLNSDPEFNGRLFTDMNLDSIGFKDTLKAGIELRNNELDNNDQVATVDNYKDIGVTIEGITRLIEGQKIKRAPLEQIIAANVEQIDTMVGMDEVSIVLDPEEGVNLSDNYLYSLEQMTAEQKQAVESQPWYPALVELIALDKQTREMIKYSEKPKVKQSAIPPDEWFMYDFENGKSTVSLDQRLETELESVDNSIVGGISTYTSTEPDRLLKVVDNRLRQLISSDFLKNQGYDIVSPEIENIQKATDRLLDLKNNFKVLSFLSRSNRENTDARILQIYMNTLKGQKDTLMRAASVLKTNFPDIGNDILAVHPTLEEALVNQDSKLFRSALLQLEVALYSKYKDDKEKILKEFEFSMPDAQALSIEFKEKKENYDYVRRIFSHNPIIFQNALLKMVDALPEKGKAPTREQQAVMVTALQNALAGEYKLSPVETTTKVKMGFSSSINGGPGSGKTSMIIPGMAHMINSITGGKVIISAFKDAKGAKFTKLKKDITEYYSKSPDYIEYNSDELIKILENPATEQATAIIFDEASLMSRKYLGDVQKKLNEINTRRLKAGNVPLHIFYTYDEYQNGFRGNKGVTNNRFSITSKSIAIPDTPRLEFSFRSVNSPLKSIEEMMRFAQDAQGEPASRAFEYDKNYNGVLVVNDRAKFEEHFKKLAERLKTNPELGNMVYINTNADSKGVPAVGEFNVENLTSLTAQGSEWEYVVVDTENTDIFDGRDNIAEVYTAVTRAKKGLIIYAPEGTPMNSVLAEVREFTPMTPASVSKEDMSREIQDIISKANATEDTEYASGKLKMSKDKKMPDAPPDTEEEEDAEAPPSGEETYDSAAHEAYRKLVEPLVNQNKTVTLNGFFTNEGEIPIKRQMLGLETVKKATQYYVTVAKIGTPGFKNILGENPQAFDGKYGIFLIGETPDGKRATLGVISNKKSDEAIRNSPIFDEEKDVLGSYPVDRSVVDSALYPHPFIQNEIFKDGVLIDVREPRSMQHIRNEVKNKGISVSSILVASEDVFGKHPTTHKNGEKIHKGEPFIALSYMHSQDELMRKIRNGAIELSDPTIQTLGLRAAHVPVDTVIELIKPYLVRNKAGYYQLPPKGHEKFHEALTLYNSFWAHHESHKQRIFREVYDDVKQSFMGDEQMDFFFKAMEVDRKDDGFILRHLLEDYISGQMVTDKKVLEAGAIIPKRRIFEAMMDHKRMNGVLKYSPVILSTGTQTNYALTQPSLKEINDKFLSAEYYRLEPFKMELKSDLLMTPSSSILAQQGDAKTTGDTESTLATDEVYSPVTPMNQVQFMRKEFPNNPSLARKAIDKFRKEVINNHLKLVVKKGEEPRFMDVNVAMDNLRKMYLDAQKASAIREEAAVNYALGRNFNGLLAQYFPAINFDTRTGKYSLVNVVHKTQGFSEQESQNLLAEGITHIVKTYLYSTPMPDGKYFNSRHIANLIPVFRGGKGEYDAVRTLDQAESALRRAAYKADGKVKMPEAAALLDRFFSSSPREKGDTEIYSTRLIEGSSGLALSDAILMFMMSAEKYMPGFTEITRKYHRELGEMAPSWVRDDRSVSYPMSLFEPSVVKTKFLNGITTLFKDAGHVKKTKSAVEIGSHVYNIKDTPGREDVLKLVHLMGLKTFNDEMLSAWMAKKENGDKVIPGIIQDYFVDQVQRHNAGKEPQLSEPINQMLETYMDVTGLGNNNQYQTSSGQRQNVLRFSAPIFHLQTYVRNLRDLGESNLLANNLLVKGIDAENNGYEFSLNPFNNTGVKVIDGEITRTKSMDEMSVDELLEFYLLDGFVNRIEQDSTDITVPVTVYSDSGTEMMPVFKSLNWMQSPRATLEKLYNSNRDYLLGLEQVILRPYREAGIQVKTVAELSQVAGSIPPEIAMQIRKSPNAVSGLHYDEKQISKGVVALKSDLVNDINAAYDPNNKEKFIAEIDADINEVIEFTKTVGGRETTYNKLKKNKRYTPEQYIGAFYANWLLLSSEFQKMMNGSQYQYKGVGSQSFIDMVKRSRSLTSPAQFFVLRNENWADQVRAFREANPGEELPMHLVYEGHKLSRLSKIFVVTDPESNMTMLNNGQVESQKIFDGATLVTPFTRVMQNYSTALGYGPQVGPVMKNITHSFDPATGSKAFIKNAEFEITPEILRNGDDWIIDKFMRMVTQPFTTPVNGANNAWELMKALDPALQDDLSNITFKHFEEAMTEMVKFGEQDSIVQELVFQSSMKTGQRAVNAHDDPSEWTPTFIDITLKGIQQDAMKDPSKDSSVKPLTQLINTIAIGWKNGELVESVYNNLAKIVHDYLDSQGKMGKDKLRNVIMNIIKDDILRTDGISYRADAAAVGRISINDRNFSDKYASTVANEIRNQAVSFPLQGGHYVVHPADNVISVYDVKDTVSKKSFTVLKSQLKKLLGGDISTQSAKVQVDVSTLKDGDQVENEEGSQFIFRGVRKEVKGIRLEAISQFDSQNASAKPGEILIAGENTPLFKTSTVDDSSTVGRYILEGGPRRLAFEDAIRTNEDGSVTTLTELYAPAIALRKQFKVAEEADDESLMDVLRDQITKELESIHNSLQTDNWTKGFAEILLPAEMKHEFHLEAALQENMPIHTITADYFYNQIVSKKFLEKGIVDPQAKTQAEMMYEAFQLRLTGIMARIPTSGFHSALVTRIAGFMEESMNSVFVPEGLKKLQGADQDIDKGAYLTFRTLTRYALFDPNVKDGKKVSTYTPNDTRFRGMVVDSKRSVYSGITPFLGNLKRIQGLKTFSGISKEELERIALENEVVRAIKDILADPRNMVMQHTSTDAVLNPLRADRDAILASREVDRKNAMRFNHLMSLLKIHEMNQAGGKGMTGIFANGSKAYNVAYARAKMTGNPGNLAGTEGENRVWEMFSGYIGATVDNANENITGTKDIDAVVAPYVNYWIAIGEDNESINALIASHQDFFKTLRNNNRYDRAKATKVSALKPEWRSLYYRADEYNLLARSLVNRDIPSSMEDIASYIITLENFVNLAYRDFDRKFEKLDLERFTDPAEESYVKQQIEQYQAMINGSENHAFNILDIMQVPHMKAYQRALVAAHKQARDVTAYDILFEMHRNDKKKDTQPRQYYMYKAEQFTPDFDFVHGLFIDAYLSSRSTASITAHDLSTPKGRQDFIDETHEQLPLLRKKYLSRNNSLIRELAIDTDKLTGAKRIRLNDFYDMNDELRTQYMEEMANLDGIDRQRLFIYNLITYRDKSSLGALSPFFSVTDKHDYLDFLDFEMRMTSEMAIKVKTSYENMKKKSKLPGSEYAIPFKANFDIVESQVLKRGNYKQMDVIYTNHIREKSLRVARTLTVPINGTPTILVNRIAVKRDFDNKIWTRRLKLGEDGKYNRTLPVNTFKSEDEFLKFSLELEYLKNKDGLTGEELMDAALVAVGKLKSTKYQKDKELNEEAKKCKIPTDKK